MEVDDLTSVVRAKRKVNLPTVLSRDEVKKLLSFLNGQKVRMNYSTLILISFFLTSSDFGRVTLKTPFL